MGREKDRKFNRRQRRRRKLRKLKSKLAMANNQEERQRLVDQIRRISMNPKQDIPEKFRDLLGA